MNDRIKLFELFTSKHEAKFKIYYENKTSYCQEVDCRHCVAKQLCNTSKIMLTNEDIHYIKMNYPELLI